MGHEFLVVFQEPMAGAAEVVSYGATMKEEA
jgi:hypothetical protein